MSLFLNIFSEERMIKHLVALSDFYKILPLIDSYEVSEGSLASMYLRKREMHGVVNQWPFNVVKLVSSKNYDIGKYKTQIENFHSQQDVRTFMELFAQYQFSCQELNKLQKNQLYFEGQKLDKQQWWSGWKGIVDKNLDMKLYENTIAVKNAESTLNEVIKQLDIVLMRVYSKATAVTINDETPAFFKW